MSEIYLHIYQVKVGMVCCLVYIDCVYIHDRNESCPTTEICATAPMPFAFSFQNSIFISEYELRYSTNHGIPPSAYNFDLVCIRGAVFQVVLQMPEN
jgi:hypothetical protein